jgi:predicted DNA-binding transcriptional regulator AlpA
MKTSTTTPLAISAAEVGAMLGVSAKTVWAMDASGTIGPAPVKLSDRVTRWDAAELREWWSLCLAEGRRIGRQEWRRRRDAEGGAE